MDEMAEILLEESIKSGALIRAKMQSLRFESFDSSAYNKAAHEQLLKEFADYEEKVPMLIVMKYMYGDIGRAYLNVQDFKNALRYYCGYMELNKDDKQGQMAANVLLLDIYVASENFHKASKLFGIIYPNQNVQSSEMLQTIIMSAMAQQQAGALPKYKIPDNLSELKKPRTFGLIEDQSEVAIRSLMKGMNISRKEATKQYKTFQKVEK